MKSFYWRLADIQTYEILAADPAVASYSILIGIRFKSDIL
jgi:hypothetical protein